MTTKLVEFDKYCTKCKHKRISQTEEPCNECLTNPINEDSHKPVMWEAKDDGKRKDCYCAVSL